MIKMMIGLLLGVSVCAVTGYVVLPKIMQAEYDKGVATGRKEGTEAGMAAGIDKGREQARAEYTKKQEEVQARLRAREAEQRRNAARARKAEKPTQNWHVRGNQLQEPIRDGEDTPTPAIIENETPA